MKILSLYLSAPSTAAIYINGKVIASVHEERFTREKNDERFPVKSIEFCLKKANINPEELDGVAIASKIGGMFKVSPNRWTENR
jgi:carbamoyltransferase